MTPTGLADGLALERAALPGTRARTRPRPWVDDRSVPPSRWRLSEQAAAGFGWLEAARQYIAGLVDARHPMRASFGTRAGAPAAAVSPHGRVRTRALSSPAAARSR